MRLDKLLFQLRFAKSRALAQRWIAEGHMRHNGKRVLRQDLGIATGDVLTLPLPGRVAVIEVLALPQRRGPAAEARSHYRPLDDAASFAIAGDTKGPASPAPGPEGEVQE